jgi:restriction endonuclease S subunit
MLDFFMLASIPIIYVIFISVFYCCVIRPIEVFFNYLFNYIAKYTYEHKRYKKFHCWWVGGA